MEKFICLIGVLYFNVFLPFVPDDNFFDFLFAFLEECFSKMWSTLKDKNFLLEEQILSF